MRILGLLFAFLIAVAAVVGGRAGLAFNSEAVESSDSLKAEGDLEDGDEDSLFDQLACDGEEPAAIELLRCEWAFAVGTGSEVAVEISFPPWG